MDRNEKDFVEGPVFPVLGRRDFLQDTLSTAIATTLTANSAGALEKLTRSEPTPPALPLYFRVNGNNVELQLDPRVTLLDALRDHLQLTGTKKGCDRGQCGACTVLVDGRRINSCMTLAVMHEGAEITTVEGLAKGDELHPLQRAFIQRDALQCGYCTPGQICSGIAAMAEISNGDPSYITEDFESINIKTSDEEIRERMSGNICRCGAYTNIVAAIKDVLRQPLNDQGSDAHAII